jgi:hypothetical protein
MVTCLCNALSCCKGGARATRVCTGICTWAVQHLGIGKGVLTWAFYRAASKSALFLDLFVKAGFPVFK